MYRILFLFAGLLLAGCSATTILDAPTPLPAQPSATPAAGTSAPRVPNTPAAATPATPSLTPTATVSRTPFPTITPLSPTPTPTATPTNLVGLWRVRHDVERAEWGYKSRLWEAGIDKVRGLPETVRINGGRGTVELPEAWVEFLDRINTPDAQRFLRIPQSGWLNYGPFPKMEQLTFGGDYVFVTRVKGNKAYIRSFTTTDLPVGIDPDKSSPYAMSHNPMIQFFSTVYTDGTWEMNTPVGLVLTLVIANPDDGPLWIDINDLVRTESDGTPLPPHTH